jgi:hypothetical protein
LSCHLATNGLNAAARRVEIISAESSIAEPPSACGLRCGETVGFSIKFSILNAVSTPLNLLTTAWVGYGKGMASER